MEGYFYKTMLILEALLLISGLSVLDSVTKSSRSAQIYVLRARSKYLLSIRCIGNKKELSMNSYA